MGKKLQIEAAKFTENVWPDKHDRVPWLLFNNISVNEQQYLGKDLPLVICQFYIGDKRPQFCKGARTLISLFKPTSFVSKECLRNW